MGSRPTSTKHELISDDEELSGVYNYVESALRKSKFLRKNRRELVLGIEALVFCDGDADAGLDTENEKIFSLNDLGDSIASYNRGEPLEANVIGEARSIIEGAKALVSTSNRTSNNTNPISKINILIALEKEINNFDIEQRRVALNLINGPQRIRGLAGSGKTVVLAMKAAHIHLQYPSKRILFTFYTKSLYGLIRDSIDRFYRHFSGVEPNWDYIDVLHSWGGRTIDGVYFNACVDNSIPTMSFSEAKRTSSKDPFSAACAHALTRDIESKYDYVLIDEAQDLPNEFFRICYQLARGDSGGSKNIVWAYDELQSIFNVYQRTSAELFGDEKDGSAKVDLESLSANLSFDQSNDLVLYKCYRNPLEVLITAHALGFAIYADRPVQMLENEEHWNDVGYTIEENKGLEVGRATKITRERENSPLSIYQYQSVKDIIQCFKAESVDGECEWVVSHIEQSLSDGLRPHDVLVISLDDRAAKTYFTKISFMLSARGIRSNNLLTSHSSAPPFSLEDMVTLSTVHRAKGNEAAIVFAIGIDALYPLRGMRKTRNKIFTAFTRTKAWLRVSGIGGRAGYYFSEIDKSIENSPSLVFGAPDLDEIETIQRDLSGKPKEILRLRKLYEELVEQGYTEKEIQRELDLSAGVLGDE